MPKELSELVERSRNLMATTLIRATVYLIGPTPEVVKQHFLPVAKAIGPSLHDELKRTRTCKRLFEASGPRNIATYGQDKNLQIKKSFLQQPLQVLLGPVPKLTCLSERSRFKAFFDA